MFTITAHLTIRNCAVARQREKGGDQSWHTIQFRPPLLSIAQRDDENHGERNASGNDGNL